jgi:hypothetical protein
MPEWTNLQVLGTAGGGEGAAQSDSAGYRTKTVVTCKAAVTESRTREFPGLVGARWCRERVECVTSLILGNLRVFVGRCVEDRDPVREGRFDRAKVLCGTDN